MKHGFTLLLLILTISGCDQHRTQIKGSLQNAPNMLVVMAVIDTTANIVSDSVRTNSEGAFTLNKRMFLPGFYSLKVNDQIITFVLYPGDKVSLSGDAINLINTYRVEGSEESERLRAIQHRLLRTVSVGDSLSNVLEAFRDVPDIATVRRQLQYSYLHELDSLRRFFIRSVVNYPGAMSSLYALYQQLPNGSFVFSQESDIDFFSMVDSSLYAKYPTQYHVKTLHANVIEMRKQLRATQVTRMISDLGKQAKEIKLPDPSGKVIALSSLRGKYVLLDFWAAWCAPCRAENPNLVANYAKYKSKNFEIYQVSLDQTRQAWTGAIKDDHLTWIHVSDLKFWDSEAVKIYGIESIPANYLIDPEGTIIAKNLRGDALAKKLSEVLGE